MTAEEKQRNEKILRDAFRAHGPTPKPKRSAKPTTRRSKGSTPWPEMLEIADAQQPQTAGPLLTEHFLACEAIEAMKKSLLGKIL